MSDDQSAPREAQLVRGLQIRERENAKQAERIKELEAKRDEYWNLLEAQGVHDLRRRLDKAEAELAEARASLKAIRDLPSQRDLLTNAVATAMQYHAVLALARTDGDSG